ncbi:MAG TPA: 16S rRNA (guanine(527)-N(7))-methyltransferase RsmG [Bdellovibrionales bacterium]|nr:16S rRNA (guanine(527)-N(7))-methyltransferase RsmG [Bdellovibrionales bacterium]
MNSDSRFPPTRFSSSDKKKIEPQGNNALWRIPEWFPDLDPKLGEQLKVYHSELLKFNLKLNLISRSTERDADEVHFADCLLALELMKKVKLGAKVHDIGSGNGIPGLICALQNPSVEFFLIESDARKCEFLKHIVHVLQLKNARLMNVRLETLKDEGIECAISRGFASISKSILSMNKFVGKGVRFFHLKGNNWSYEIAELPSQLISVWTPELVGEYSLPSSQARRAVVCTTKVQD